MQLNNKHKKIIKVILYCTVVSVVVFWGVFGIVIYQRNNNNQLEANNAARIREVAAMVYNVKSIDTIEPSKTSGNLPSVVNSFTKAKSAADDLQLAQANILQNGIYTDTKEYRKLHDNTYKELENVTYRLENTIISLSILQKFIEYSPSVDLYEYKIGGEKEASERLFRTKEGIENTINDLEKSKIPYRKGMLDILRPLVNKSTEIKPDSVDEWAIDIMNTQTKILDIIENDYKNNTEESLNALNALAEAYLDVRK